MGRQFQQTECNRRITCLFAAALGANVQAGLRAPLLPSAETPCCVWIRYRWPICARPTPLVRGRATWLRRFTTAFAALLSGQLGFTSGRAKKRCVRAPKLKRGLLPDKVSRFTACHSE